MSEIKEQRAQLQQTLFDGDIPKLWCPPLTHYTEEGVIDHQRIENHWKFMTPYVRGFMVPGTTSDGWELSDEEVGELLGLSLDLAAQVQAGVIIPVLKDDAQTALDSMGGIMNRLQIRTGIADPLKALIAAKVHGFVVCPPRGPGVSQSQIHDSLSRILDASLPVILYQIPQLTQSETAPETMAALAARYSNLIMFKDSSGGDKIARQDRGGSGVFLTRGAEGDFFDWTDLNNGPYNGFLLSTANCFASELWDFLRNLDRGATTAARDISDRITSAIKGTHELVTQAEAGNPYTNAAKALDHFMAFGPDADNAPPPMLHAGVRLPAEVIKNTGVLLSELRLLPEKGYLAR